MPNAPLQETLEQLRESYSQRQKSVNSLLAALKGTSSSLGKASRFLREYADQNVNGIALSEAQASFAQIADPLLPDLRREAKNLNTLTAALRDALTALRGEAVDVVRLGRAYQTLQANATKAKLQHGMLQAILPEIHQELQYAQRSLADTFGQALRDALAELGIEIRGRPPRFELGRFEINADFVNRTASILYGKDVVSRRAPLSVEAVVKAYQRDVKLITGRNEDGDRWIELFYQAWQNAQRKRDLPVRPEGVRVNIVDCYFELVLLRQGKGFRSAPLKRTFVEYTRAEFVYDFFEFANQQRRAYRGRRVNVHSSTKSQTESPDKSFWIVEGDSPFAGRYMTDVEFVRES